MSTQAAIARRHGDGFLGVYHHWDGYPNALGKTLWDGFISARKAAVIPGAGASSMTFWWRRCSEQSRSLR